MITHRQLSILNAIVEDYVHTDQPVGSKSLIERHNLNVSPATIRNEMKQLESLNLIEKTHTSSGRSPSELGFRYYVDQLLDQTSHQQQQKIQRIREILIEHQYNISTALDAFANELSIASQYTTLVMRPNHKQDIISNIHLVRANDYLVVMVVVFTSGHVEHLHLATQSRLDNDELNKISNFVTAKYNELSTYHFENDLNSFTQSVNERKFIRDMLETLQLHFDNQSNGIFMGGKVKLIDALNETNVSSIQPILQYIESNKITQLLDEMSNSSINVKIGHEIESSLSDISIVTSEYHIDDRLKGQIAVIGPTAMNYQNVIRLLNTIW